MSLWTRIAGIGPGAVATTATAATGTGDGAELSQVSQLSHGVESRKGPSEGELLSQVSQLSQCFEGDAALADYDGGLTRTEAERAAAEAPRRAMNEQAVAGQSARARGTAGPTLTLTASGAAESQAGVRHPSRWRGDGLDLGDLRPCVWCRNLTASGRCLAAWRGTLRAASDYAPTFPVQPRRCIGYLPADDDPDQRPGDERWPELAESQAPRLGPGSIRPSATRPSPKEVA